MGFLVDEVLISAQDPSFIGTPWVLISSVKRPFKLHEVVTVLEEEGAEIVNANFSVTGQQTFHTIHCRV
ncbi:hypothetical protein PR202_ga23748 [Eleusine coracana subsp. coracana]|uniref:Uncharacterized protein n=1 Tax=Eleusine coracana subsp. coracana TaxID=191504 RepID=A0AAV5D6L1_ELECO|nr:hypothetical protein PR202_ga23748 [Eleusine coracana subsp. coracana]